MNHKIKPLYIFLVGVVFFAILLFVGFLSYSNKQLFTSFYDQCAGALNYNWYDKNELKLKDAIICQADKKGKAVPLLKTESINFKTGDQVAFVMDLSKLRDYMVKKIEDQGPLDPLPGFPEVDEKTGLVKLDPDFRKETSFCFKVTPRFDKGQFNVYPKDLVTSYYNEQTNSRSTLYFCTKNLSMDKLPILGFKGQIPDYNNGLNFQIRVFAVKNGLVVDAKDFANKDKDEKINSNNWVLLKIWKIGYKYNILNN